MVIRMLDRSYAGLRLDFEYVTDRYYDVKASENGFSLELKRFGEPQKKSFSDELFADWLEAPVSFGAFENDELLGVAEGSIEQWHNVFRVSNILVFAPNRRCGVGQALMDALLAHARASGARGAVLETQSCNYPAICFYRKNGFALSRIDLHEYTNDDIERHEVRFDLFLPF